MQSVTPECTHSGLGSSAFARRYLRNRCFFLFLRVLRCFSSPGSLPYVMNWRMDTWGVLKWVSPFRNLRIKGYLLLPEAYRSLSRLSSALSAKASTLRSYMLDHNQNCIFIHSSRTDSVLCSLVAGISWFFFWFVYWTFHLPKPIAPYYVLPQSPDSFAFALSCCMLIRLCRTMSMSHSVQARLSPVHCPSFNIKKCHLGCLVKYL